jgi:uncharacterized protein YdeI (YjbR/CyaY-like superfamily)
MTQLRRIVLGCDLTEELKWGKPCYTFQESNVVIIIPFKESCALMFCKGSLLKDVRGILDRPGENSQATRWIKFTNVPDIVERESILLAYIHEAIALEKAGLKVAFKKTSEFKMPAEFKGKLAENPALKKAFTSLTPGRQRAYLLYFSAAKQSKTREARIGKCLPHILKGRGLNDR